MAVCPRVLLGNRAVGGYGIYVSKTGEPVTTCDLNELSFNSNLSDATSGIVDNKGAMYAPYANGTVTRNSGLWGPVTTWPTSDFTYTDSSDNDIVTIPLVLLTLKNGSTTQTDSWQYNATYGMSGGAAYVYAGGHNSLGLTIGGGPYNRGTLWSFSAAGDIFYVILKQILNF